MLIKLVLPTIVMLVVVVIVVVLVVLVVLVVILAVTGCACNVLKKLRSKLVVVLVVTLLREFAILVAVIVGTLVVRVGISLSSSSFVTNSNCSTSQDVLVVPAMVVVIMVNEVVDMV